MARNPARFLAPIALVAFAVALFLVLSTALKDDTSSGERDASAPAAQEQKAGKGKKAKKKKKTPKTYTVKAGDTPSGIAEKADIPLDRLLELNPDLDPQVMTPGMKLKLR